VGLYFFAVSGCFLVMMLFLNGMGFGEFSISYNAKVFFFFKMDF